jgi:sporulation protein YlmC with PRC-barrel domain
MPVAHRDRRPFFVWPPNALPVRELTAREDQLLQENTMLTKYLAAAVMCSVLSLAPAMAQTPKSDANAAQNATTSGLWQSSKLIHLNVYNAQNEKIGDIKELMLKKDGNIESVVIGVGGFLGMGERDVAVKFSEMKWIDEPVSNSSASTAPSTSTTPRPTGTTGTGNTMARSDAKKTYPDHAVYNATKDQLKAMPQFDYNK